LFGALLLLKLARVRKEMEMVKEDRDGARDENGERDGDVERRKK
jgi:hypothetical protein